MPSIRPTLTEHQTRTIINLLRADTTAAITEADFDRISSNRKLDNMLVAKCHEVGIRIGTYQSHNFTGVNQETKTTETNSVPVTEKQSFKPGEEIPSDYVNNLMAEFESLSKSKDKE